MQKEKFIFPTAEVVKFDNEDVITSSNPEVDSEVQPAPDDGMFD